MIIDGQEERLTGVAHVSLCGDGGACAKLKPWEFCSGFHAGWENTKT